MLRKHYRNTELPPLKGITPTDKRKVGGISWLDPETIQGIENGRIRANEHSEEMGSVHTSGAWKFKPIAVIAPCLAVLIVVLGVILPSLLRGGPDIDPYDTGGPAGNIKPEDTTAASDIPDDAGFFIYVPSDLGTYKKVNVGTLGADGMTDALSKMYAVELANAFFEACYENMSATDYKFIEDGGAYETGADYECIMTPTGTLELYLTGELPDNPDVEGEQPGGIIIRCLVNTMTDNFTNVNQVRLYVQGQSEDNLLFERFDMKLESEAGGADETEILIEIVPSSGDGWQCVRTDGTYDDEIKVELIKSAAELKKYYESNRERYDLESRDIVSSDTTIGFADAIKPYGDEYFTEHDLVLVVLTAPSGSIRFELYDTNFESDGKQTKMLVRISTFVPEMGTDDMAAWHMLIVIPKTKMITDGSQIKVLFIK